MTSYFGANQQIEDARKAIEELKENHDAELQDRSKTIENLQLKVKRLEHEGNFRRQVIMNLLKEKVQENKEIDSLVFEYNLCDQSESTDETEKALHQTILKAAMDSVANLKHYEFYFEICKERGHAILNKEKNRVQDALDSFNNIQNDKTKVQKGIEKLQLMLPTYDPSFAKVSSIAIKKFLEKSQSKQSRRDATKSVVDDMLKYSKMGLEPNQKEYFLSIAYLRRKYPSAFRACIDKAIRDDCLERKLVHPMDVDPVLYFSQWAVKERNRKEEEKEKTDEIQSVASNDSSEESESEDEEVDEDQKGSPTHDDELIHRPFHSPGVDPQLNLSDEDDTTGLDTYEFQTQDQTAGKLLQGMDEFIFKETDTPRHDNLTTQPQVSEQDNQETQPQVPDKPVPPRVITNEDTTPIDPQLNSAEAISNPPRQEPMAKGVATTSTDAEGKLGKSSQTNHNEDNGEEKNEDGHIENTNENRDESEANGNSNETEVEGGTVAILESSIEDSETPLAKTDAKGSDSQLDKTKSKANLKGKDKQKGVKTTKENKLKSTKKGDNQDKNDKPVTRAEKRRGDKDGSDSRSTKKARRNLPPPGNLTS